MWDRNYDAAEAAFKKCVELSPNYTRAGYGTVSFRCRGAAVFTILGISGGRQ